MRFFVSRPPWILIVIWAVLSLEFIVALWERQWPLAFVALLTLGLTLLPSPLFRRFGIQLPRSFLIGIVAFIFATIFLGEAFDFYNRYWWWDVVLHAGSALGFGLLGFLFVFTLFEGDRFAAPAWALALIAFCMAVTIGTLWEIFEFGMDRIFGLNMQKSGLVDTMGDLIVDVIGAAIGALAGFFYLKGRRFAGFPSLLDQFIRRNRRFFRKRRE
jgi:hypothetical protein